MSELLQRKATRVSKVLFNGCQDDPWVNEIIGSIQDQLNDIPVIVLQDGIKTCSRVLSDQGLDEARHDPELVLEGIDLLLWASNNPQLAKDILQANLRDFDNVGDVLQALQRKQIERVFMELIAQLADHALPSEFDYYDCDV